MYNLQVFTQKLGPIFSMYRIQIKTHSSSFIIHQSNRQLSSLTKHLQGS